MKVAEIPMRLLLHSHNTGFPYVYQAEGRVRSAGMMIKPRIEVSLVRDIFRFDRKGLLPTKIWLCLDTDEAKDRVRVSKGPTSLLLGDEMLFCCDWQIVSLFNHHIVLNKILMRCGLWLEVWYDDSEWYDEETFTWLR